jgi:hypothetical protein
VLTVFAKKVIPKEGWCEMIGKKLIESGIGGILPMVASGKFGDENRGFALGLAPGLMYRNRQKKKGAGGVEVEVEAAEPAMKKGGKVKGKSSSASKRADGCATKGKTRGKMV